MRCVSGVFLFLWIVLFILACERKNPSGKYDNLDYRTKIRLRQYLVEGKRLYQLHCANCHQADGTGLASLYPPLNNSDYLMSNRSESICGMRYGQKGEIVVNGISFNQEMPGIINLTDLEIAEIATYVYTEFTDTVQIITINEVRIIMDLCMQDSLKTSGTKESKNPN